MARGLSPGLGLGALTPKIKVDLYNVRTQSYVFLNDVMGELSRESYGYR